MKRDYATTFAAEAVVVGAYFATFKLVAVRFGPEGFAEYALSRRVFALLAPLVVLGLDVGLTKFTAVAGGQARRTSTYTTAALVLTILATAVSSALLFGFAGAVSTLLFGSSGHSDLVEAMPFLLAGTATQMVGYSYLRGSMRIQRANALLVCNQGLAPVLAFFLAPGPVASTLCTLGIAWIAISAGFLVGAPFGKEDLLRSARRLIGFSFPRVPGDLLQLALFALPGILIAHTASIRVAGIVALGTAIIGMAGTALVPISFVLMPRAAAMLSRGELADLSRQVGALLRPIAVILLACTGIGELLISPGLHLLVGSPAPGSERILAVLALGVIPWGVYITLRAVIDVSYHRPVNAENMFVAAIVFATATGILWSVGRMDAVTVSWAYVLALYALGAMTVYRIRHIVLPTIHSSPITSGVGAEQPKVDPVL